MFSMIAPPHARIVSSRSPASYGRENLRTPWAGSWPWAFSYGSVNELIRSGDIRAGRPALTQRVRPPGQLVEQHLRGAVHAFGVTGLAILVELLMRQVKADGLPDGDGVQLGEDRAQVFYGAQAAGETAVGDEPDGFGVPFRMHRVDGQLERGGVAVVVLGGDHHERIGGADAGGKRTHVGGMVFTRRHRMRLLHSRYRRLGEID